MQLKFRTLSAIAVLFSMQLAACLSSNDLNTPRSALEGYVKESFNIRSFSQKANLESFLTGDTKDRLSAWTEDQFMTVFVDSKRKFVSMKMIETNKISEDQYALTYEIVYTEGGAKKEARITQKKMAMINKVGNDWKISQVHSQREAIEYLSELSLP
jgi:hypothetical protein